MKKITSKIDFFVPIKIEKGGGVGGQGYKIEGVCSTSAEDTDEETLIPSGYDFSPLLKSGFFNWNHQASKDPKAIVGEPTRAEIIDGGQSLWIEGFLYPTQEGKRIIDLAETLEKYSPDRRLGFSIEGKALERDPLNPKKVTKALITGVAITQSPKNPRTLLNLVKGDVYEEEELIERTRDDAKAELYAIKLDAVNKRRGGEEYDEVLYKSRIKELKDEIEEFDKAMMVNTDINPESVEGQEENKKLFSQLEKSEVYEIIQNRLGLSDASQITRIYNTIKNNSMKVTETVLEKALLALEGAFEKGNKAEKIDEEEEGNYDDTNYDDGDDDEDDEDIEKADEDDDDDIFADDEDIEKGDDEDEDDDELFSDEDIEKADIAENLIKAVHKGDIQGVTCCLGELGVNLTLASHISTSAISEASNLKNNGGEITTAQTPIVKGDTYGALETTAFNQEELQELVKSSLSSALEVVVESNERKMNQMLQKGEQMLARLDNELAQPVGRKSIPTANALPRDFEKSQGGGSGINLDRNNAGHVKILVSHLSQRNSQLLEKGVSDNRLQKAIEHLEIAKSTNYDSIEDHLQALGITI